MSDGLGMRYAFIGPFETAHLNAEGTRIIYMFFLVCSSKSGVKIFGLAHSPYIYFACVSLDMAYLAFATLVLDGFLRNFESATQHVEE